MGRELEVTVGWMPYSGHEAPRSPGRMLLSQFLELFYDVHWNEESADIRRAFDDSGSAAAAVLASTMDFLGSLVAEGTVAAMMRPIGGGELLPMKLELWEIDSYDARFRFSALSIDDWASPAAKPTHWIFVSETHVETFIESWSSNTFNEPVVFDTPRSVDLKDRTQPVSGDGEEAQAMLLRLPAVMARTGLSRSTIYERIAAGTFPSQVRLGARAAGWYQNEVDAWVRSRRPAQSVGR